MKNILIKAGGKENPGNKEYESPVINALKSGSSFQSLL